jgi:hypothetical protein
MLSFESLWWALLPAVLYFGIHLVEGERLTPMLLARRFTLNPVLIIPSLVFWFWMWGVLGAILAVPMLAILKIISDRLRPLGSRALSRGRIAVLADDSLIWVGCDDTNGWYSWPHNQSADPHIPRSKLAPIFPERYGAMCLTYSEARTI